jgi:MFS family permease
MPMAIFGRILCGFGSAEVVNRQLISACVNFEGMTKASALFVASSAIGMSVGPLLAGILELTTGRDEEVDLPWNIFPAGGLIWDNVTSPGYVMAGLWLLEFFALVFFFSEPKRINGSDGDSKTIVGMDDSGDEESDEDSPLITKKNGYGSVPAIKSDETKVPPRTLWSEIAATVKLIVQNPGLPLTVVIFGYIEMTDEVLISSCAMITRRYFGWHGSVAGFLIASLGALVLPAHFVVEKASHLYSERRILSVCGHIRSVWRVFG